MMHTLRPSRLALSVALAVALAALLPAARASAQGARTGDGFSRAEWKTVFHAFLTRMLPRGDEKKAASGLAVMITQSAHPTGDNADLLRYQFTAPAPNRIHLRMEVEYFGGFSGRQYPG